jgi:hypothetical protein
MPLIIHTSVADLTKTELEAHIMAVQSRRMVAAVTYYRGANAKHQSAIDKDDKRLGNKYVQLGKKLTQLDKLINSIEALVRDIDGVKIDRSQHMDKITVFDTDADETPEE